RRGGRLSPWRADVEAPLVVLAPGLLDDARRFERRGRAWLRSRLRRDSRRLGRIEREPAPPDRGAQGPADDGVDLADAGSGQRPALMRAASPKGAVVDARDPVVDVGASVTPLAAPAEVSVEA